MNKLDITAIILTYNEERHIARSVDSVAQVARRVVVVDCHSTDRTAQIATARGAEVVPHAWPGNQAEQFNWAIDNLTIGTEWVFRLDADEYLTPELVAELRAEIPQMPARVTALSMQMGRCFMGRRMRYGVQNGVWVVRMFRTGCARYERRIMDEHLSVLRGEVRRMRYPYIDDNKLTISEFTAKHDNYAAREAVMLIDQELGLSQSDGGQDYGADVAAKRRQKAMYARMPLFWRAAGYFAYRYFLRLGFMNGWQGFVWDFMQGWWYRTMVDVKLTEIRRACGNDKDKVKRYIKDNYGIEC